MEDCKEPKDYGGRPYALNVVRASMRNSNLQTTVWAGCYLRMTLMCISPRRETGLAVRSDADQMIRIEQGRAIVQMGECRNKLCYQQGMRNGDAVFIPAGMWHNVLNVGRGPLRVSCICAPPEHHRGKRQHPGEDIQKPECGCA